MVTALSTVTLLFVLVTGNIARGNVVQLLSPHFRRETDQRRQQRNYYDAFYSCVQPDVPRDSSVLVYTENMGFFARSLPGYQLMTAHYTMLYPTDFDNIQTAQKKVDKRKYIVVEGDFEGFEQRMDEIDYTLTGGESLVYQVDASQRRLVAVK